MIMTAPLGVVCLGKPWIRMVTRSLVSWRRWCAEARVVDVRRATAYAAATNKVVNWQCERPSRLTLAATKGYFVGRTDRQRL